jgi:hypothetical protein
VVVLRAGPVVGVLTIHLVTLAAVMVVLASMVLEGAEEGLGLIVLAVGHPAVERLLRVREWLERRIRVVVVVVVLLLVVPVVRVMLI